MKKIIAITLICSMLNLVPGVSYAVITGETCTNHHVIPGFSRTIELCNNLDDIICKDVKKSDRRGCSKSDEYIFSDKTTAEDVYSFAKGCFKSGVTSFAQFFTDFLPEVIKEIWKLTTSAAKAVADPKGTWNAIKGLYESAASLAVDVYEAAQESPGAYFGEIWNKLVNEVGSTINNFDCLKPQIKVEKICGAIGEWIVPPAIFAKLLVKGVKAVKKIAPLTAINKIVKPKPDLKKVLAHAETRPIDTYKGMSSLKIKYMRKGYTSEEFDFMYKSGAIDKLETLRGTENMTPRKIAEPKKDINEEIKGEGMMTVEEISYEEFEKLGVSPKTLAKKEVEVQIPGFELSEATHKEFFQDNALDFKLDADSIEKSNEAKKIIELNRVKAEKEKLIRLDKERRESFLKPKQADALSPNYKSNYLEVVTKNEMGIYTSMPMELVKKIVVDGKEKYLVRIYDSTSRDYVEKTLLENEIKAMRPKETEKTMKQIQLFKKETGMNDGGVD